MSQSTPLHCRSQTGLTVLRFLAGVNSDMAGEVARVVKDAAAILAWQPHRFSFLLPSLCSRSWALWWTRSRVHPVVRTQKLDRLECSGLWRLCRRWRRRRWSVLGGGSNTVILGRSNISWLTSTACTSDWPRALLECGPERRLWPL